MTMRRLISCATALILGSSALACSGSEVGSDAGTGDTGGGMDGGTMTGCMFDTWLVTSNRTLTKNCSPYIIDESVEVQEGAILTVEAGVELRIDGAEWLRVGELSAGTLDVNGTADDPVIITTSGAATPGSWYGVIFAQQATNSSIENAVIRYGGRNGFSVQGCLTVLNPADGAVTLSNVRFVDCEQSGLSVEGSQFTASGLVFEDSEAGLYLDANVVGSVTEAFTYDATLGNIMRGGDVLDTATWVAQPVPYAVEASVEVTGPGAPALTLNGGLDLAFDGGEWLRIGEGMAATLVVAGSTGNEVRLRGEDSAAAAGDWFGLLLADGTRATTLDYLILEQGGRNGFGVGGCLTVLNVPSGEVSVTNSTFKNCDQSGVAATSGNRFSFAAFDGNSFEDSDSGLWLNAGTVASIAADQTFTGIVSNRLFGDEVQESGTWARQPIPWAVEDSVAVRGTADPVLTIAAGGTYVFDRGTWLQVGDNQGGGLVVAGTMTEPVLFESDAASAGDWFGIKLEAGTLGGTSIDYATIRHGGRSGFGTEGCLTVEGPSDMRVSVRNSTFEFCNQSGVGAESPGIRLAAFENNSFGEMDVGYRLHPNTVGDVSGSQTYVSVIQNEVVTGIVETTATWSDQAVPYVMEDMEVEGIMDPVLTLEANLRLRFGTGDWLRVGVGEDGGLNVAGTVAQPVILESTTAGANGGEWHGLFFGPSTLPGSVVDFVQLRHAGRSGFGYRAGLTVDDVGNDLSVTNSTFTENDQADVYIDCPSNPTLTNNTYSSPNGLVNEPCPS